MPKLAESKTPISSAEPAMIPSGSPPVGTLLSRHMSGTTPYASCAPPYAKRKPVTISSKSSGMPCFFVRSRTPRRNSTSGGTTRWNGSQITPASSSACSAMMAAVVSRSLKGAMIISSVAADGIPAESGTACGYGASVVRL